MTILRPMSDTPVALGRQDVQLSLRDDQVGEASRIAVAGPTRRYDQCIISML